MRQDLIRRNIGVIGAVKDKDLARDVFRVIRFRGPEVAVETDRAVHRRAAAGKFQRDHAAEAVTGFFTKYGDGGADVLPLSGLSKRQGRAMLEELGAPEVFTTKAPTADLLDGRPGQTDESELGVPYALIDDYLEGRAVPDDVAVQLEARYDATEHKRALPVAYTAENE